MFAVIELGGKQYLVRENEVLRIEKIDAEKDSEIAVSSMLLFHDGTSTHIGTPYLKDMTVKLKIKNHRLHKKVSIFKMKAKKRYKRLRGHRQPYSEVEVVKIG